MWENNIKNNWVRSRGRLDGVEYRRVYADSRMWLPAWTDLWLRRSFDRAITCETDKCLSLCAAVCLLSVRLRRSAASCSRIIRMSNEVVVAYWRHLGVYLDGLRNNARYFWLYMDRASWYICVIRTNQTRFLSKFNPVISSTCFE